MDGQSVIRLNSFLGGAVMAQMEIVDGPGKYELERALFDGKIVQLTIAGGRELNVLILSVEAEDGSRESWNLVGRNFDHGRFKAYFETRRRHGTIEFT